LRDKLHVDLGYRREANGDDRVALTGFHLYDGLELLALLEVTDHCRAQRRCTRSGGTGELVQDGLRSNASRGVELLRWATRWRIRNRQLKTWWQRGR
jgi:hypothetical protein